MPIFSKKCDFRTSDRMNQCTMLEIQSYIGKAPYPIEAITNNQSGKVYISLIVEKNGSIDKVKLLRSCDFKVLDENSISHLKNIPSFYKPGYKFNKPVRIVYNIPIVFKLDTKPKKRKSKR
jgi:TonB family protein